MIAVVALVLTLGFTPAMAQIAVVVNKSNPVNDLALADLKALYLGHRTTFPSGAPAELGEYRPARRAFYRTVLNLTESAVSRHWIGVVFSEGHATPPRTFRNAEAAYGFVLGTPAAICFIPLDAVTDDVKVVTVGGLEPRDPGYPLR